MKAMLVNEKQELVWTQVPDPVIKEDEVLVKICAALRCSADDILSTGYANTETHLAALDILKQALYLAEKENS